MSHQSPASRPEIPTASTDGPPLLPLLSGRHPPDCWRTIGVSGNRSCPELETFIHCRNCPVLADAARTFFDRPAPDGYLENWSRILEIPDAPGETAATSVLVFRLEREWFALPADVLVEVTTLRSLHRVPHRGSGILEGLVNIRGQLQLSVSLHRLLGLAPPPLGSPPAAAGTDPAPPARLLMVEHRSSPSDRWVFAVDQVAGVLRVERAVMRAVPSTVSQSAARYSQTLFDWQAQTVALLDDDRVFADLRDMVSA
ncbi:MAG: chemotaxis protein [Planctomycetia bacterium]|nr:chemotaxis protein [Planctomycetia bacterium]